MKRIEILVSGFGGQGVVRFGQIFSTAAVYEGLYTTMLVSHGTETRGGYVRSQVVISDEPIDSPVVENPDYFCAMSRSAYTQFGDLVKHGTIIFDPGFIDPNMDSSALHIALPARTLAVKELGQDLFSNIIFLGALGRYLETTIRKESFLKALEARVHKFPEKNRQAFDLGYTKVTSNNLYVRACLQERAD